MKWFDRWFYRKARWCWHRAGIKYPELKVEQDALDEYAQRNEGIDVSEQPAINYSSKSQARRALISTSDSSTVDMDQAIRFSLLSCTGGMVLEIRHRDRKTHDTVLTTHIIPDTESDIAAAVGRIVAMELWR